MINLANVAILAWSLSMLYTAVWLLNIQRDYQKRWPDISETLVNNDDANKRHAALTELLDFHAKRNTPARILWIGFLIMIIGMPGQRTAFSQAIW